MVNAGGSVTAEGSDGAGPTGVPPLAVKAEESEGGGVKTEEGVAKVEEGVTKVEGGVTNVEGGVLNVEGGERPLSAEGGDGGVVEFDGGAEKGDTAAADAGGGIEAGEGEDGGTDVEKEDLED